MRSPLGRLATILANAGPLTFGRGFRGWRRNRSTVMPALGSTALLLFFSGTVALSAFAVGSLIRSQGAAAYTLHVYLADAAAPDAVESLRGRLADDPRVAQVRLIDKDQALGQALRRPGLAGLVDSAGGNPFPASLELTLRDRRALPGVAASVASDPAVDPGYPTSYDPAAYGRLQQIALVGGLLAAAFLCLLGLVAVAVTANSVRSAILARRDEIRVMRLVGAPWWAVRGPFLVEAALTGTVAGCLAGAALAAGAIAALDAGQRMFVDVLPGVTLARIVVAAAAVWVAGTLLGGGAGLVGVRRLPP